MSHPARAALAKHTLDGLLEEARERWRGVQVEREAFAAFLAARRPPGAKEDERWLADVRVADLALACACLAGDRKALGHLEVIAGEAAADAVSRSNGGLDRGGLQRQVLDELLVTDGRPPRLASFAGRGSLSSFVRTAALRIALSDARARWREVPLDEAVIAEHCAAGDEEIAHLKRLYRPAFEAAVSEALAARTGRDRSLLRLYFFEHLSHERIAAIYGVHTATAWRWIDRITRDLRSEVVRRLAERLELDVPGVESVVRLVASQLHLDLHDALATRR
jgi:RNA polymerase sigma-70 factor, ECF subfamily